MHLEQKNRYSIDDMLSIKFEPGSRNRVYKNLLGIKNKRDMDFKEFEALENSMEKTTKLYDVSHRFTAKDIIKLHRIWLSEIYPWAGQYRCFNAAKNRFHFAAANQIEKLMIDFQRHELKQYTPCNFVELDRIKEALAITHTELILIHPFLDGNGRVARLLAILMALQAGLPILDFSSVKGRKRQSYFSAVQAGLKKDYEPMIKIFDSVIKKTLKAYS